MIWRKFLSMFRKPVIIRPDYSVYLNEISITNHILSNTEVSFETQDRTRDEFGNTLITYSDGSSKLFRPHQWLIHGEHILKNYTVIVKRHFIMIYKFQPFSIIKALGFEYNSHCALVPKPDDWILILDYDAMILSAKAYQVIEAAIKRYPETEVFGAMTNRIGLSFQQINGGKPNENDAFKDHLRLADKIADDYQDGECKEANQAAGFFLLFKRSYWDKHKFQDGIMNETGNLFDYMFTKHAGKEGKLQIIKGVYVFHQYRMLKEDYRDRSHLK